jgi:hypothetical protein
MGRPTASNPGASRGTRGRDGCPRSGVGEARIIQPTGRGRRIPLGLRLLPQRLGPRRDAELDPPVRRAARLGVVRGDGVIGSEPLGVQTLSRDASSDERASRRASGKHPRRRHALTVPSAAAGPSGAGDTGTSRGGSGAIARGTACEGWGRTTTTSSSTRFRGPDERFHGPGRSARRARSGSMYPNGAHGHAAPSHFLK